MNKTIQYCLNISQRVNTEEFTWLLDTIQHLSGLRKDTDAIMELERESCDHPIASTLYGNSGLMLQPFGFYHPSVVIPATTNNAKRGKVVKSSKSPVYQYDLDAAGIPRKIICFDGGKFKTFCAGDSCTRCYVSYEEFDGKQNIACIAAESLKNGKELQYYVFLFWSPSTNFYPTTILLLSSRNPRFMANKNP
jgi:hypothetical protein